MEFFTFFLNGVKDCLSFDVIGTALLIGVVSSCIVGALWFMRGVK